MEYVRWIIVVTLFNLATAQAVFADSFGDKFRSWLLGSTAQAATLNGYQSEPDSITQGCIRCHDGSRAGHITVKDANAPMQFSSSGLQVNHPVGMNYDDYAATRTQSYTPSFLLDSNIILVDGKVTCVSCHRLKEAKGSDNFIEARWDENQSVPADIESCSASGELTVGPRETDLCLACHSM
jgi:cytochrome c peroxidase